MKLEFEDLLALAERLAGQPEPTPAEAATAVLAAHAALEAAVNRFGSERIASFNQRARFLPKWHDLCERVLGRQLNAAPDLEHLHAARDALLGYRGPPERLDRRATTPPPEAPSDPSGAETARWAVATARRVLQEFEAAAG